MNNEKNIELNCQIIKDNSNYKGFFIENEEEDSKFFEFGSHFPYKELYSVLESLRQKQIKMKKERQIQKIFKNDKKKFNLLEKNKNKIKKLNNNLNNTINLFKPKGKSRNVVKESKEYTFVPKNKSKNILSIKKGFNSCKSTNYCGYYSNSINYLKIYKNKIYNIKLNPIKHTKLSEKHSTSKKKQNNTINQKNYYFQRIK